MAIQAEDFRMPGLLQRRKVYRAAAAEHSVAVAGRRRDSHFRRSSTDETLRIIAGFHDPRIRLFPEQSFRSPVYNVENALRQACGEVIFLSDQDDEWVDGWVEAALSELVNTSMVVSNALMIDAEGRNIPRSEESISGGVRKPGFFHNLYRNGYMGCCCAFRREVLEVALPFPKRLPWHDWWIGLVAAAFFRVVFLDAKWIRYRRHGANASPTGEKSRFTLAKKIVMRWRMSTEILRRALERKLYRKQLRRR